MSTTPTINDLAMLYMIYPEYILALARYGYSPDGVINLISLICTM